MNNFVAMLLALSSAITSKSLTSFRVAAMMMEGNGLEAVKLSVLGSTGSVVRTSLHYPLSAISAFYDKITVYSGITLLKIVILMAKSEAGPVIEGQGPLVHLKCKDLVALRFLS
jgi:putative membrane protein